MAHRVLLVDVDSRMPNLALMKLSAHHKARGDEVSLCVWHKGIGTNFRRKFDRAYLSCVFTDSTRKIPDIVDRFRVENLYLGGYGVNAIQLKPEVEHVMPDYSLYGTDFSMGFTSRGCPRKCEFCNVWRREGPVRDNAPISEFLHPDHKKLILMDNNLTASPKFRETLECARGWRLKLCVTQGYDARLIDEKKAAMIASVPHYNRNFTDRALYTAWDKLEDEKAVLRGIRFLIGAGITPRKILPYVLVGFGDYTLEQDLYRFNTLRELGTTPFVMPFNNRDHPMRRWGQRPALYKSCTFEEYRRTKSG